MAGFLNAHTAAGAFSSPRPPATSMAPGALFPPVAARFSSDGSEPLSKHLVPGVPEGAQSALFEPLALRRPRPSTTWRTLIFCMRARGWPAADSRFQEGADCTTLPNGPARRGNKPLSPKIENALGPIFTTGPNGPATRAHVSCEACVASQLAAVQLRRAPPLHAPVAP